MPEDLRLKPLSARSVVVSLLMGAHPDPLSASQLVAAGEHFALAAATVRVALTRAVARGDLVRSGSTYGLGPRLRQRRSRQEDALHTPWSGRWETVVVVGSGRPGAERAALREVLTDLRLAELREGVWLRPANLARPLEPGRAAPVRILDSVPQDDPVELAGTLWDLGGWAVEAEHTLALLGRTQPPAERLAAAAHLVRHLATDPLLPPELLPTGWPGPRARSASAAYEEEVRAVVRGR